MKRLPKTGTPKRNFTVHLEADVSQRLEEIAKERDVVKAWVLRDAVFQYIERYDREHGHPEAA